MIFAGVGPTAAVIEGAAPGAPRRGRATGYDVETIAAAMGELADSPLAAAERERLSAWSREHHDIRQVAQRVTAVLESARHRWEETR